MQLSQEGVIISNTREVKSSVFSLLLENPIYALQVFNTLNGSNFDDPSEIELYNLAEGASLLKRNDAAFIIRASLNIYEHQSTLNPNMPLRDLMYLTPMYESYIKDYGLNLYSSKLQKVPTPHFIVFYNGTRKAPAYQELKLSDAFLEPTDNPDLELICHMYNINPGYNDELIENCPPLKGYTTLIEKVRSYNRQGYDINQTVKYAIDACISEHVLEDFLKLHRLEVEDMIRIDGTWEEHEEFLKKEAYEDGKAAGIELGEKRGIELVLSQLALSEEEKEQLRKRLSN